MMSNSYKKTSIGLILFLINIYIMNYSGLFKFIDSYLLSYWVIPSLWIGLIVLLLTKLPRIHGIGKLRHKSPVYIWAFNGGVAFVIANILGGVIEGFGKSPYNHELKGIVINIIWVGIALVGREYIRAYLVNYVGGKSKSKSFYWIIAFMTVMNINLFRINTLTDLKSIVIFLAEQLLPETCENILATYLVLYGGPLAAIIYIGITEAFEWLSPILPDLDWLAKGVIGMGIPMITLTLVSSSYMKLIKVQKSYTRKEESVWYWLPTSIGCVLFIWFIVGVFPIYPSAIATGSMEPMIYPGDVVLVKKVLDMEDLEALKVGDVIQFQRRDILINHRIIEVLEKDRQIVYRTKGDNNSVEDSELVKREDIRGTIASVIPKVGWPTLMFKSENSEILTEVEF